MSDDFTVRSLFREYEVLFVEDVVPILEAELVSEAVVVIDQRVIDLHGDRLSPVLDFEKVISIDATEESKTLEGCQRLIEMCVERGFRRDGVIVAIGGGIVQDIAAFAASILFRGVQWLFVPTTLLAQADSCLGSKTSINLGDKKNLIGNYYPPNRIFIDAAFLQTLSVDDVKSGIGEILHFFFYAGSSCVAQMMSEYDRLLVERSRLRPYIRESLRIKKVVAEQDEFDKGERKKFNYGHTFGHALESATGYAIRHGLAVTVGMDLANYVALRLGRMTTGQFNEMHLVLRRNFPEADFAGIDLDRYLGALSKDKKNVGDDLVCILASRPGALEKVRLRMDDELRRMIGYYFGARLWAQETLPAEAIAERFE